MYEANYPIEKVRLVDEYNADDETSMSANNSSCFNYRTISGTNKVSMHGRGLAVDINPLYNPYHLVKDHSERMPLSCLKGFIYSKQKIGNSLKAFLTWPMNHACFSAPHWYSHIYSLHFRPENHPCHGSAYVIPYA